MNKLVAADLGSSESREKFTNSLLDVLPRHEYLYLSLPGRGLKIRS